MLNCLDNMKKVLNILIACEESQAECSAFRKLGHNAYSCDIQPCKRKGHPEWHIWGDVRPYLQGENRFLTQDGQWKKVRKWDLIICHPPCTYLCKVGSMHLYQNPDEMIKTNKGVLFLNGDRFRKMQNARKFFFECLNAHANFVAVENPIPMRIACLPSPDAYACPSWYGEKYTKKTLYWLKGLPALMASIEHPYPKCYVKCSRGKYRSRTFPKMAMAIAEQWSQYIIHELKNRKD